MKLANRCKENRYVAMYMCNTILVGYRAIVNIMAPI